MKRQPSSGEDGPVGSVPNSSDGRPSLLDHPATSWPDLLAESKRESYRARQIGEWVFQRQVYQFSEMNNLPLELRDRLARHWRVRPPKIDEEFVSVDGSRRYLLRLDDGQVVEAVQMPYQNRVTLCISSQVGCRFACTFCQTGRLGARRDLRAGEILGQVLRLGFRGGLTGRVVNVVFMGQGEPLDNLTGVLGAVRGLQDGSGPSLSWRRMIVSTVGIVPALHQLGELGAQRPRIAVSLNATNDETRSKLMPVNRKWGLEELLGCLRRIPWRSREQVTFEYVMLAGINDTKADAGRLGGLLRGLPAKVNLIPWNPVPSVDYKRPAPEIVEDFRLRARRSGLKVLVRYSRGADIGAACGQLHAAGGEAARRALRG